VVYIDHRNRLLQVEPASFARVRVRAACVLGSDALKETREKFWAQVRRDQPVDEAAKAGPVDIVSQPGRHDHGLRCEHGGVVKLYYTTDAAEAILILDGDAPFHDDRYRLGGLTLVGVIVSDRPLDANEGRFGEDVFEMTMPDDLDLDEYEIRQQRSSRSLRLVL
jgi:hypothetical protein